MVSSPPLLRRLFLPMVGLAVAAVAANVGFAAWLAAGRSAQAARSALGRVERALASNRVPLTRPVVEAMGKLAGCELVVVAGDDIAVSTLNGESGAAIDLLAVGRSVTAGTVASATTATVTVGGQRYRAATLADAGSLGEDLIVLSPEASLLGATWQAVWPTVAVAAATLVALVPLGYRTARRLSQGVAAVEGQVARIADGDFGSRVDVRGDGCAEIDRLADGVNRMSQALARLRESLVAGERQRLLGQVAAGFAHELRNAVTGARLAIELHARRCRTETASGETAARGDASLSVALRQLEILESELRGLLTLARDGRASPHDRVDVMQVVEEVSALMAPRCELAGVALETSGIATACDHNGASLWVEGRQTSLRSALLNLAINAVDAAGRGGMVRIAAWCESGRVTVAVEDTGAGPPESIRDSLTRPFVTTKPEGLGLGLPVALAVAREHGGTLDWERVGDRTRFTLSLPALSDRSETPSPSLLAEASLA